MCPGKEARRLACPGKEAGGGGVGRGTRAWSTREFWSHDPLNNFTTCSQLQKGCFTAPFSVHPIGSLDHYS